MTETADTCDAGASDAEDDSDGTCAYATGALMPDMRVSSLGGRLPMLGAMLAALFRDYSTEHQSGKPPCSPLTKPFSARRCSVRHAAKLRRDGVCCRLLSVIPDCMNEDPYSVLRPCVQLFRSDGKDGIELDPEAMCVLELVLSYDVREGTLPRMSERALRDSDAEDMVLVRRLVLVPAACNAAFAKFRIPGPPLAAVSPADFRHFELLPLSVLARPRAVFPAVTIGDISALPAGVLTPWCCSAVNVFLLQ